MIYGGVSWPHKRPGFAVILGMGRKKHLDSYDICLLDEYKTTHLQELIQQCGALDFKYRPSLWIGDPFNNSASQFINEMNSELEERPGRRKREGRPFYVSSTTVMGMDKPYNYLLDTLRILFDEKKRLLFLKDSKILNYLQGIEDSEIADLEVGDYPAIEALAFAVIAMRYAIEEEDNDYLSCPNLYNYDPMSLRDL